MAIFLSGGGQYFSLGGGQHFRGAFLGEGVQTCIFPPV